MVGDRSLSCSQKSTAELFHGPGESSPHSHTLALVSILILSSHLCLGLPNHSLQLIYCMHFHIHSAVGIATGYGLDGRGSILGRDKTCLFSTASRIALGPSSLLPNGYRGALSPGVKRPGREADNSPPTSAEVKNTWIYTHVFMT
jgi:hypothetical protein